MAYIVCTSNLDLASFLFVPALYSTLKLEIFPFTCITMDAHVSYLDVLLYLYSETTVSTAPIPTTSLTPTTSPIPTTSSNSPTPRVLASGAVGGMAAVIIAIVVVLVVIGVGYRWCITSKKHSAPIIMRKSMIKAAPDISPQSVEDERCILCDDELSYDNHSNCEPHLAHESCPVKHAVSSTKYVQEVMHEVSQRSCPTSVCIGTEIRQGNVVRKSGYDGEEVELYGREGSTDGMEEYPALTHVSRNQQDYETKHPILLPTSGLPIDPLNTKEYIPEWFSPVATLSQCTHDGRHYYDEANDFSLEIPEGAIPEGETVTIDIGVALYGPFQYPEGLRPVSPVFWLCVRDKNFFRFMTPVTVTLPHYLNLRDHDDIESLGLKILKGDHELNSWHLHKFKKAEGNLFVEPLQKYGLLQTTHFCSLCIVSEISRRLDEREVFCISAVIPHTFSPTQASHAYFYMTYMLQTCLTTVKKQMEINIPDLREHEEIFQNFHFSRNGDQFLEIVLPQTSPDWTVGLQCPTKVCQCLLLV